MPNYRNCLLSAVKVCIPPGLRVVNNCPLGTPGPELSFVSIAANDWNEPISTDAAICMNVGLFGMSEVTHETSTGFGLFSSRQIFFTSHDEHRSGIDPLIGSHFSVETAWFILVAIGSPTRLGLSPVLETVHPC